MNGLFLSFCVIILNGPLANLSGTAIKYDNQIYTVEYIVGKEIPFIQTIEVHESNLKQCDK